VPSLSPTSFSARETALELVGLAPLMERTSGHPEIVVGLIDGPVRLDHPDLVGANIRSVSGRQATSCERSDSIACLHGTSIAGMLCARRDARTSGVCRDCALVLRTIFSETDGESERMPSATPGELAEALTDCIDAGASVINVSAALVSSFMTEQHKLIDAVDYAARKRVLVVAAAGNGGAVGGSALTRHQWVIPVIACTIQGVPMASSNLGAAIGRRGLAAPGSGISSLNSVDSVSTVSGTSVAAPLVTGAIALLWSQFPSAAAEEVRFHLLNTARRRTAIVPPLLDAWASYQAMMRAFRERGERRDR
jgi:subtilisin family serine protease